MITGRKDHTIKHTVEQISEGARKNHFAQGRTNLRANGLGGLAVYGDRRQQGAPSYFYHQISPVGLQIGMQLYPKWILTRNHFLLTIILIERPAGALQPGARIPS